MKMNLKLQKIENLLIINMMINENNSIKYQVQL